MQVIKNHCLKFTNSVKSLISLAFSEYLYKKENILKNLLLLFSIKALFFSVSIGLCVISLGVFCLFGLEMFLSKEKDVIASEFSKKIQALSEKFKSIEARHELESKVAVTPRKRVF